MTRTVLAVICFIVLAMPISLANVSRSDDAQSDLVAIRAVSKAIIAADNSRDLEEVSELYEDEAVWLPPSGPVLEGKALILARYKASFDRLKLEYSEQSVETQFGGDWAFDRGFVTGVATPNDGSAPTKTHDKYIMILHRGRDHRWKIARLMWSPAESPR